MTYEMDLRRLEPFLGSKKVNKLWRLYDMEDAGGRRDVPA